MLKWWEIYENKVICNHIKLDQSEISLTYTGIPIEVINTFQNMISLTYTGMQVYVRIYCSYLQTVIKIFLWFEFNNIYCADTIAITHYGFFKSG